MRAGTFVSRMQGIRRVERNHNSKTDRPKKNGTMVRVIDRFDSSRIDDRNKMNLQSNAVHVVHGRSR